jgi:prepilin-type N-terminal cleavage/methylation domain-containing protein
MVLLRKKMLKNFRNGFTLLELTIVLVIVGLLAGGIFVGKDLIRAAEIRFSLRDIGKYNTALNAFELKYGGLPGDVPPQKIKGSGLFELTIEGYGDGNGLVGGDSCSPEGLVFWRHLGEAQLISGQYGMVGNNAIDPATGSVTGLVTDFGLSFPRAKFTGTYVTAQVIDHPDLYPDPTNVFILGGVIELAPGYCTLNFGTMTPINSYQIDAKLDDGRPTTGTVKSIGAFTMNSLPDYCLINATSTSDVNATYNTLGENGNIFSCMTLIPFSR